MKNQKVGIAGILLAFSCGSFGGAFPSLEAAAPDTALPRGSSDCDGVVGNLVENCGFESGDFTGWVQSGDLTFRGVDRTSTHSGVYGAFFGPIGELGYIAQTLPTTAGQTYNITFWLQDSGRMLADNEFQVRWDGSIIYRRTYTESIRYRAVDCLNLIASQGGTELGFGFYNGWDYFYLDDVVAVAAVVDQSSFGSPGCFERNPPSGQLR